jgi:hypothetical protein
MSRAERWAIHSPTKDRTALWLIFCNYLSEKLVLERDKLTSDQS